MKIAIVTPTFPPYSGGIGNVAAANARELVRIGYEVTIFTPLYRPVEEEYSDLNVKRLQPRLKYGNAAYLPKLKKMLLGFDIIHLHYPFFGGAEVICRYQRRFKKRGAKIVLHYHMDVVGQGIFRLIFKLHNQFILPRMIKMADKVILTSFDYGLNSNIARWLKKNPDKFAEVPNGVDSNIFSLQPKDPEIMAKLEIDPAEKVVLFVGGLDRAHYFKGVEYLLEAMNRLRQMTYIWKLVIVGEGDLKKDYMDLAEQLLIHKKTIFAGFVANADLPKYFNLADVVVLPSIDKSEAFGLVLIEGMSCAKPVVASDLAGVRSVVTNEIDGLLAKPKDADDLASKINYFLEKPNEALDFGRAGRRKVLLKYDWRVIGDRLNELYKNIK